MHGRHWLIMRAWGSAAGHISGGSLDPRKPARERGWPHTGTLHPCDRGPPPKRNYSSSFRASSLLPIHQKLPGISAFFITRVNICHANKARGYFSPLRNRICNDTGFLMSPTQYNMYLNADERLPVRPRLHRQKSGGGKGAAVVRGGAEAWLPVESTWERC